MLLQSMTVRVCSPLAPLGSGGASRAICGAPFFSKQRTVPLVNPISLINWSLSPFNRLRFGPVLTAFLASLGASFQSRAALQLEILALRHQLGVLQRAVKRPKLSPADRVLWAWLSSVWTGWESRVSIVKAATVIGWQREGLW